MVIPCVSGVTTVDATGALILQDAVAKPNRRGMAVLSSGMRPGQRQVLDFVGVLEPLCQEGRADPTTPEAIQGAGDHLEMTGPLPVVPARTIRAVGAEPTR